MRKINDSLMDRLNELIEKSTEKEMRIEVLPEWEDLKEDIVYENREWIVEKAYENNSESFNGRIYLDVDTGELIPRTMTSNSYIRELSIIQIYELSANWESNAIIRVSDVLDYEEYEELCDIFGDNVNHLDRKQLKEIGVDLDERLKEFLVWVIEN